MQNLKTPNQVICYDYQTQSFKVYKCYMFSHPDSQSVSILLLPMKTISCFSLLELIGLQTMKQAVSQEPSALSSPTQQQHLSAGVNV